jgi:hypothetical protein
MGARIPVESITNRVSIGCNLGAEVSPGIFVIFTISLHISFGFLITTDRQKIDLAKREAI